MARFFLVILLFFTSAGASRQAAQDSRAMPLAEGEGTAAEDDDISTGTKVAIGVGAGALAAIVIYGVLIVSASAALLASG